MRTLLLFAKRVIVIKIIVTDRSGYRYITIYEYEVQCPGDRYIFDIYDLPVIMEVGQQGNKVFLDDPTYQHYINHNSSQIADDQGHLPLQNFTVYIVKILTLACLTFTSKYFLHFHLCLVLYIEDPWGGSRCGSFFCLVEPQSW